MHAVVLVPHDVSESASFSRVPTSVGSLMIVRIPVRKTTSGNYSESAIATRLQRDYGAFSIWSKLEKNASLKVN